MTDEIIDIRQPDRYIAIDKWDDQQQIRLLIVDHGLSITAVDYNTENISRIVVEETASLTALRDLIQKILDHRTGGE